MKFNKDIVALIAVSCVILFGWQYVMKYFGWDNSENRTTSTVVTVKAENAATPPASQPQGTVSTAVNPVRSSGATTLIGAVPVATSKTTKIKTEVVCNENMSVNFSIPELAMIDRVVLKEYKNAARSSDVILDNNLNNTVTPALQPGALSVNGTVLWTEKNLINHGRGTEHGSYSIERLIVDAAGNEFKLLQTWVVGERYTTNYTVSFSGISASPVALGNVIVSGGDLQSLGAVTGDKERGVSHNFDYTTGAGKFVSVSVDDSDYNIDANGLMQWVGISNKYFAVALQGEKPFRAVFARHQFMKTEYLAAVGAVLDNVTVPAAGDGAAEYKFTYYSGPKIASDLSAFSPSAAGMMHLSWGPLDYLARFMLMVLVWLHSLCGSYGWSIIILTIIVRLLLFPITRKANLSMKKMADLQPKIKALREEYKARPEILNQKTMELYKTEKINPLGGCLPLLLQFPIFIALYQSLSGAVQLRQIPFWWSPDLAGPDTVATLFGLAVNPLVIAMTLLMVLQQHLTPSAMDPMQKKMMYLMPVVMLFFFYDMPSGLTLYWTVSQIFSILQMYLQRKLDHKGETPMVAGTKS